MRISDWSSDVCSSDLCQMNRHRLKRRIIKNAQAMLKAGRKLRAFDHPGEYLRDVKPGHNRFFGVDFLAALQHDALCRLTVEQDALYLAVEPDGAAMILETAHQRVCQRA